MKTYKKSTRGWRNPESVLQSSDAKRPEGRPRNDLSCFLLFVDWKAVKTRSHQVCLLLGTIALLVAVLLPYACGAVADANATGYLAATGLSTDIDHVRALYTAFERADPTDKASARLQPVGRGKAPGSEVSPEVLFNLYTREATPALAVSHMQVLLGDLQRDLAQRDIPALTVTPLGEPSPIHPPWAQIMVMLSGWLNWVCGFFGVLLLLAGLWRKGKALPPPLAKEKAESAFDY